MREQSSRQPSVKYLTAQSLFLEINGKRDQRLRAFQSKENHNKSFVLQLSQELEADLSFYCEAQREVDRLLDVIHELKLKLVLLQMETKLDRSITNDFIQARQLDLEFMAFSIEQLKPKIAAAQQAA